jgi:hypothetical protein
MKRKPDETIIVIDRHGQQSDGQPTALTGWRLWLAKGAAYVVFGLVALVGLAAALGLAMTFAMVLLVAIPLVLVLVGIAYFTGLVKVDVRRNRF